MYYKDTQVFFFFFLQDKVALLALGARSTFSPLPKAFFKMGPDQHVYRERSKRFKAHFPSICGTRVAMYLQKRIE